MDPNENSSPTYYNSSYRHGVDEKRRVQIPAKWRPAQPDVEFTLVLWPQSNAGPCVRALPPAQMAALMKGLSAMPNTDPNKVLLKRFVGSESVQAPLDKSGRICLPEKMAQEVGITEQAVLVGLLDCFEIWSPERYEKVKAADAVMAPEAFKLMG